MTFNPSDPIPAMRHDQQADSQSPMVVAIYSRQEASTLAVAISVDAKEAAYQKACK